MMHSYGYTLSQQQIMLLPSWTITIPKTILPVVVSVATTIPYVDGFQLSWAIQRNDRQSLPLQNFAVRSLIRSTTTLLLSSPASSDEYTSAMVSNDTIDDTNKNTMSIAETDEETSQPQQRQTYYLQGLYENLQEVLDQYMISGNQQRQQQRAYNILEQIQQYENEIDVESGDDNASSFSIRRYNVIFPIFQLFLINRALADNNANL